jgi:hypothetical protein
MSFAESFEDLKIWQRARVLANQTYDAFEKCREFDFRNQIQSAAMGSAGDPGDFAEVARKTALAA